MTGWSIRGLAAPLSRRCLLQGAAAGVAVSPAACSARGKPAPRPSPSGRQPEKGGTLTYAGGSAGSYDTQGRTFDPHVQTPTGGKSYSIFYDRLLGYNLVTYEIEPELAAKWEQPSPSEYLFHLQPNVKWQNKPPVNGRPMTTDDVLWSLERARTDDPRFSSRSLLEQVDKIQAPDASTIRFTTRGPDASTLKRLATDSLAVLSRETRRSTRDRPPPTRRLVRALSS